MAKGVLAPLGLTGAASDADAGIHKKVLGSGHNTTLVISNNDMQNLEIVTYPESSGLLKKIISEKIKNEAKEQRGRFLSMLLGTLGASLLGDMLFSKKKVKEL